MAIKTKLVVNPATGKLDVISKPIETIGALVYDPTGFPNRTDTTMSFDDGTLTFSIQPTGTNFKFYSIGNEFTSTGDTVAITDTEGLWFIYYTTAGVLTSSQTPWSFSSGVVFVAIVYWDATNNTGLLLGEERHGISMDWATHQYLHNDKGSQWISGGTPSVTVDGNGSLDAHAEIQSIAAGVMYDEDISNNASEATTYSIWYKDGANGYWRKTTASAAAVAITTSTPDYNQWTGAVWQRTPVVTAKFTLTHLYQTNDINNPFILIMGENQYDTATTARDGAETEINSITTNGLPSVEFVPIATFIVQVNTGYTNSYNARLISTADGGDFVDWRENQRVGVGGSTNHHGNLTGLLDDDHTQYLLASSATDRSTFATNWTDLTDAGATTLHKHDHGGMDGLSDDDHTQYALLAGRSGGQTLIGGTASSNSLTLSSTSNVTKGKILFGSSSAYDEVNNRLGIGTVSPNVQFDLNQGIARVGQLVLYNQNATAAVFAAPAWASVLYSTLANFINVFSVAPTIIATENNVQNYGMVFDPTFSDNSGSSYNILFYRGAFFRGILKSTYAGNIANYVGLSVANVLDQSSGAATVTNLDGIRIDDLTRATSTNVGLRLSVSNGTGKWNIYANGTADNHLAGDLLLGSGTALTNGGKLQITGGSSTEIQTIIKGAASQSASLQEWWNSSETALSKITSNGELEITDSSYGIILKSPDSTRWRVTIDNTGALTTTSL